MLGEQRGFGLGEAAILELAGVVVTAASSSGPLRDDDLQLELQRQKSLLERRNQGRPHFKPMRLLPSEVKG